jgi:hypothetical protein
MSWAVRGLMGWFGKSIRVRLGIRLDPFLGVKLASLYREMTYQLKASNENINLLGLVSGVRGLMGWV